MQWTRCEGQNESSSVVRCCRYNDGLDQWRLTATEVREEFAKKGADVVYAFQTRNPTHAGHAYLMRTAGDKLREKVGSLTFFSPLFGTSAAISTYMYVPGT